ncbi:hypothetical protein [Paraburkholderia sp. J8-2]|uniref:hypothetical protein n=1 Tax=Paraburkholderia sp. J8-2 TaxID=2805440 RepID=UPI002AB69D8D|nr:hypothetical protein [Paraburkholderia sp. J8-2]
MLSQLEHVGLYALICGIVVGGVLGACAPAKRIRYYPFGGTAAVLAVVLVGELTLWWAAVLAATAGQLLGIIATNAMKRERSPRHIRTALSAVLLVYAFVSMVWTNHQIGVAVAAMKKSDEANWTRIATSGKAGEFVNEHYRDCIAIRHINIFAFRFYSTVTQGGDPTVCAAAAVERARQVGGDAFAKEVSGLIEKLPELMALSPEAEKTMNRVASDEVKK